MFLRYIFLLFVLSSCRPERSSKSKYIALPDQSISIDSLQKFMDTYTSNGIDTSSRKNATVLLLLNGLMADKKANYKIAQQSYSKAIRLIQQNYDTLFMAKARRGLANAFKNQSEYESALGEFKQSLILYEALDDKLSVAHLHGNIGQVFQLQNDLQQAQTHLLTGLKVLEHNTNTTPYLVLLHTLANVYGMQNKFERALALDEEGIRISTAMNLPEYTTTFLDNKANCFLYSNQTDSAQYYFEQCLFLDTANKKQMSDTWLNLGILAEKKGNAAAAIQYFKHSIVLAQETAYKRGQMVAWESLYKIYKSNGNFPDALDAQTRYFTLKDSIQNFKKEKAIEEWKVVYNTETKDKTILLNQLTIQKKNIIIAAVLSVFVLLIVTLNFRNRRNKLLKKKEFERAILDKEQQAIIDILSAEEKERKRIAGDLHDGLGQSLTSVWLQLQALNAVVSSRDWTDEEANKIIFTATTQLENCCVEARELSHNLMPNILLDHGLELALHKLIANIDSQTLAINLDYRLENDQLSKTAQLLIYRIIQECLNNVLKHANATELDLCICEEDKHLAVLIEDNGMGFKTSADQAANGIGMQNIISRVQFLNGTAEWSSQPNQGTVVALYIPMLHDQ